LTVPLKPLRLFNMILVKVDEPADRVCEALIVESEKLGVTGPISDPFWTDSESTLGLVTVTHVFGTLVPEQPVWKTIPVPLFDARTLYTMVNRLPVTGPGTL